MRAYPSTAGSASRSASACAYTLAANGRRPCWSRSVVVNSSQQASGTKAEATRSNGAAKPSPPTGKAPATASPPTCIGVNAWPETGRFASIVAAASGAKGSVGTPGTGSGA